MQEQAGQEEAHALDSPIWIKHRINLEKTNEMTTETLLQANFSIS